MQKWKAKKKIKLFIGNGKNIGKENGKIPDKSLVIRLMRDLIFVFISY